MKKSEAKGAGDKNVAFIWSCGLGRLIRSSGWHGAQAAWRGRPRCCVLLRSALNSRTAVENVKAEMEREKETGKTQAPSSTTARGQQQLTTFKSSVMSAE